MRISVTNQYVRDCLILISTLLCNGTSIAQETCADPDIVDAWKRVLNGIYTADVIIREEQFASADQDPPPLQLLQTYHVCVTSKHGLFWEQQHREASSIKNIISRQLVNPQYSINISPRLNADQSVAGWLINSEQEAPEQFQDSPWAILPWASQGLPCNFVEWLSLPGVKKVGSTPIPGGTRRVYTKPRSDKVKSPCEALVQVQIDISDEPSRHPLAIEYTTKTSKGTSDWQVRFQYQPTKQSGIPVLQKMESKMIKNERAAGAKGYLFMRTLTKVEAVYNGEDQREKFYLSHYGLPEPPGITAPSRPTPTYVWLLLATGGLGILALASRWLLKRRTKTSPAS